MVEPPLTAEQERRYNRQILVPEIGVKGQRRLLAKRVTVIGQGGLGSPVALYLAAAGVGHLRVVDCDVVSMSNLQRQILYARSDVGHLKVDRAKRRLEDLNEDVTVEARNVRVTPDNVDALVAGSDVIVDCSDNFHTKHLVNTAAVRAGTPGVICGVQDFQGQLLVVLPGQTACYRCVFGDPPDRPREAADREDDQNAPLPIVGATAGVFGCLEASETLKLLLEIGRPLAGRLVMMNLLQGDIVEIAVKRNEACPTCGGPATSGTPQSGGLAS